MLSQVVIAVVAGLILIVLVLALRRDEAPKEPDSPAKEKDVDAGEPTAVDEGDDEPDADGDQEPTADGDDRDDGDDDEPADADAEPAPADDDEPTDADDEPTADDDDEPADADDEPTADDDDEPADADDEPTADDDDEPADADDEPTADDDDEPADADDEPTADDDDDDEQPAADDDDDEPADDDEQPATDDDDDEQPAADDEPDNEDQPDKKADSSAEELAPSAGIVSMLADGGERVDLEEAPSKKVTVRADATILSVARKLESQEEYAEAAEAYEAMLLDNPSDVRALRPLVELYEQMEAWVELQRTLFMLADALDDQERRFDVMLRAAAIAREKLEDYDAASAHYQQILEWDPDHEAAKRALENLRQQ